MNTSLTINSTKNLIMWYNVTYYNALHEFDKLQFICLIGGRVLTWGRRVPASAFVSQGSMP